MNCSLPVSSVYGMFPEKAMAPHSSTLAWKIPWVEKPGGLQSMGSLKLDTSERFHFHFSLSCIGEGNGNPLQCSCLENPRDGGAWWAAVYWVAQSRTWLKRLSSSSSSMGCSRQAYWSGLPFPSLGDLPISVIKPTYSALQADSLPLSHQGSLHIWLPT